MENELREIEGEGATIRMRGTSDCCSEDVRATHRRRVCPSKWFLVSGAIGATSTVGPPNRFAMSFE